MTTWAERLQEWRDPANWDEPPTEEQAVSQLVYSAISDFVEERAEALVDVLYTDETGDRLDALLNEWIDAAAASTADQPDKPRTP